MIYLGMDPGANGGIACINTDSGKIRFAGLPETRSDLIRLYNSWDVGYVDIACVERVSGFIGGFKKSKDGNKSQHGNMAAAHTTFKLGESHERCLFFCDVIVQATDLLNPTPRQWQKPFNLRTKGKKQETTSQWKGYLKKIASKLYPRLQLTLNVSDAILLMHYALITGKEE